MSSITAIFGNSDEDDSQESDKLLQLYWKRAELKKEFAGMRNEQFKLQGRLKQEQGATARLQQKLDHLEEMLADPECCANVLVFYQLRGLARRCHDKLAKFSEQLKQQREQKRHSNVLADWNDARAREAHDVEQRILESSDNVQQLECQLQAERHRLTSMSGFLKFFRRRSATAILDSLAEQLDVVQHEELDLAQDLQAIRDREPPDNEGLDDMTKRTINFLIIAFAQQLIVAFNDDAIAEMARESNEKSVGAIHYGDSDDCKQLLSRILKRIQMIEQATGFVAVLQKRAKLIADTADFTNDSEVVPVPGTVATLYDFDASGRVKERDLNVVGLNYFGITTVLCR